jgi:hypothetical protein
MRFVLVAMLVLALALCGCDSGGRNAGKSEQIVPEEVAPDSAAAVDTADVIR